MCGIVGVCLREGSASPALLAGLGRLEYRGYDSAGLAVHLPGLPVRRTRGRVEQLAARLVRDPVPDSATGIAHTRWATHGAPSERNAHPHRFGPLVAVHNGILENYEPLADAVRNGGTFASETDSEVWVALLADELGPRLDRPTRDDLLAALARAMGRARGSFALAILHEALPGQVFFARRESPLVVGVGRRGNFVASDVAAVLSETRDFVYVGDERLGFVTAEGYGVYDCRLVRQDLPVERVDWDPGAAAKGGYAHYMLKEIEEQPLALGRQLQAASPDGRALAPLPIPRAELGRFRRVILVACGTALHAAQLGKYILEEGAGLPVDVDYASEFRYRGPMVGPDDLVVAVTQSGETADTLGAMRVAAAKGATLVAICNVRGATACRLSRAAILTHCGPEIGVASTKAFTGQILALHLLALRLAVARGILDAAGLARRLAVLRRVRSRMEPVVGPASRDHIRSIAVTYARRPVFFFLGRGPDYPIALEGALKLKEVSYVHAEGYPAGEMKHGPLALVSEDMVVVALAPGGPVHDKVLSNLREVKARGGTVVVVTNRDRHEALALADHAILVPPADPLVAPLLHAVPLQYLAYYVALELGRDIDKPRNLAKSVTVE